MSECGVVVRVGAAEERVGTARYTGLPVYHGAGGLPHPSLMLVDAGTSFMACFFFFFVCAFVHKPEKMTKKKKKKKKWTKTEFCFFFSLRKKRRRKEEASLTSQSSCGGSVAHYTALLLKCRLTAMGSQKDRFPSFCVLITLCFFFFLLFLAFTVTWYSKNGRFCLCQPSAALLLDSNNNKKKSKQFFAL